MKKRYFSYGISKESIEQMIACFNPIFKDYGSNDVIIRYSDQIEKVGIILSGSAKLYFIDENGDTSLLEKYTNGDIFGDVFSLPLDNYEYLVTAETPCKVIFLDYNHIITPCEKVCHHHSQLISNLFLMTAQKSQDLSLHISILNQRNTRKKLLAYFNYESAAKGSNPFEISISYSELAEYLSVERTSMMREIRLMKEDGLINTDRRKIWLLE